MNFFEGFPWNNKQSLNLDWLLKTMQDLLRQFTEFKAVNTLTYGGIWDITKNYPAWTIVTTKNSGYISLQPVPAGIPLTNRDYWVEAVELDPRIAALIEELDNFENRTDANFENVENMVYSYHIINISNPGHNLPSCIGDDLTDNTSAIQEILTFASNNGFGIYVPSGTYLMKVVNFPNNIRISGENYKTTVFKRLDAVSAEYSFKLDGCDGVSIENMSFDANSLAGNQYNHAVGLENCKNILFRKCYFTGGSEKGNGIVSISTSLLSLDNCIFEKNGGSGCYIAQGTSNTRIYNCQFLNNDIHGLDIYASVGCTIYGCIGNNNGHDAFNIDGDDACSFGNCIASNCGEDGFALWGTRKTTLTGCVAYNCERAGFFLDDNDAGKTADDNIFSGCVSMQNMWGFYCAGNGAVNRATFNGCHALTCKESGFRIDARQSSLVGCAVDSCCQTGNNKQGISLSADLCIVVGCRVTKSSGSMETGVTITTAKCMVANCNLFDVATPIYNTGSGTIIANNITAN